MQRPMHRLLVAPVKILIDRPGVIFLLCLFSAFSFFWPPRQLRVLRPLLSALDALQSKMASAFLVQTSIHIHETYFVCSATTSAAGLMLICGKEVKFYDLPNGVAGRDNFWAHVSVVYRSGEITVYFNGAKVGTESGFSCAAQANAIVSIGCGSARVRHLAVAHLFANPVLFCRRLACRSASARRSKTLTAFSARRFPTAMRGRVTSIKFTFGIAQLPTQKQMLSHAVASAPRSRAT